MTGTPEIGTLVPKMLNFDAFLFFGRLFPPILAIESYGDCITIRETFAASNDKKKFKLYRQNRKCRRVEHRKLGVSDGFLVISREPVDRFTQFWYHCNQR